MKPFYTTLAFALGLLFAACGQPAPEQDSSAQAPATPREDRVTPLVCRATDGELDLHQSPSYSAEITTIAEPEGTFAATGPSVVADGSGWVPVEIGALSGWASGRQIQCALSPPVAEAHLASRVQAILAALSDQDYGQLAAFVAPERGLRVTMQAPADPASDIVVDRDEVAAMPDAAAQQVWGYHPGTGEPIQLTFPEVLAGQFNAGALTSQDVIHSYGQPPAGVPFLVPSSRETYPDAAVFHLLIPGTKPALEGMDTVVISLVLQPAGDEWYLSGLIRSAWTP